MKGRGANEGAKRDFLYLGCLFAGLLFLASCASTAPYTAKDVASDRQDKKIPVLIRIAPRTSNGEHVPPFDLALADDNVTVATGHFETGGKMVRDLDIRFLSEESRAEGWFILSLPRGTFYLVFLPPRQTDSFHYQRMFNAAARWRVDAPTNAEAVYAGTLSVESSYRELVTGGKYIRSFGRMETRDDNARAAALARSILPPGVELTTVLMVRHQGPIILTTPSEALTR